MKRFNVFVVILLLLMILFRDNVLIIFNNVYNLFRKQNDYKEAEILVLEEKVKYLENEYNELNNFKKSLSLYANYNYLVTRVIFRENYFYNAKLILEGGSDDKIKSGMAVINENGLVGIIGDVYKNTCELILLSNVKNLSVNINGTYGKLIYEDNLFKIKDISRDANINLNDEVYTSTLGNIKEQIYIGKVDSFKDKTIEKEIVIESDVDFLNLNYLLIVGDL